MRPKRYILSLIIVSALALSVFSACEINRGNLSGDVYDRYTDLKEIQSFQFHLDDNTTNTTLTYTVSALVTHDPAASTYRLAVPYPAGTDLTQLTPRFSILGDNLLFTSNEATPLTTTLTSRSTVADFLTAAGVTGDPPATISVEAENNTLLDYEFYLREDIVPAISPNVSFTNQRTNDPSVPFTVIFNRPINDTSFNAGDIISTLGYVSGKTTILSQREYNFYVNYDGTDGLVTVSIPRGRVQGAEFGLDNSASNTPSFYFDRTGPEPGNGGLISTPDTGYDTDYITLEWEPAVDVYSPTVYYKILVTDNNNSGAVFSATAATLAGIADTNVANFPHVVVDWTLQGTGTQSFIDDAGGAGLSPGRNYIYNIVVRDDLGNYQAYSPHQWRTLAEKQFSVNMDFWDPQNPTVYDYGGEYFDGEAITLYVDGSELSNYQNFTWHLDGFEITPAMEADPGITINNGDITLSISEPVFQTIHPDTAALIIPYYGYHTLTCYALHNDGRLAYYAFTFQVRTN